jgi:hypothetical protein
LVVELNAAGQNATSAAFNETQQLKYRQQKLLFTAGVGDSSVTNKNAAQKNLSLSEAGAGLFKRFEVFDISAPHQTYQITIAADVPDHKRPMKVYYKNETGHVFVILEQKDTLTQKAVAQVFGFYPVRPVSSLFLRTVKCKILNNGGRVYDAAVTQRLTKEQFEAVRQKAVELSYKKYNLNKYNCYDYALGVFNSIPGADTLPLLKVKFPFVFGKGGSPCGLYKQLFELKETDNRIKISIGMLRAPLSTSLQ